MNTSPSKEGMSQLSAWLMSGRVAFVEIHSTQGDTESTSSDRLVVQNLGVETLRSYLVEQDWTQQSRQKAGTFVLDSDSSASVTPASIRSSTPLVRTPQQESRIPSAAGRSRIPSASHRRSVLVVIIT